jgi:ribosomal protein S18 acetylase RimI-like enzyme
MSIAEEITIRTRQDHDLAELGELLREVHALDGYPVEGVDNPRAWLTLPRNLGIWVAELDGQVVGHVALTHPQEDDQAVRLWRELNTAAEPDSLAVLGRLFVSPTARGRHLGRRLTETATHHARALGRQVVLDVMVKDQAAIRTYRALGWQFLGDIQHEHGGGKVETAQAYAAPGFMSP